MDLWQKMREKTARILEDQVIEESRLETLMDTALIEAELLFNREDFIEPEDAERLKVKWMPVYRKAQKETEKITGFLGLTGKTLKRKMTQFRCTYAALDEQTEKHNLETAKRKAEKVKKLIPVVEGRELDQQQLLCIAKEAHNHLVLAGAGTGKTTTIVGYVKYLLLSGKAKAEDILVLSFTRASAEEMRQRLKAETGLDLAASTFHKLGLEIIARVEGKRPQVCTEDIRKMMRQFLNNLINRKEYLSLLCSYMLCANADHKSEFDFESEEEYTQYLKYHAPVTLNKETVKSYGELEIANFLLQNQIKYIYENSYFVDTASEEYSQYKPDFYLPEYDIYIEYFGIDRKGNVPPYFSGKAGKSASQVYNEGMEWKRKLHKEQHTCLVEVYAYEKMEGCLLEKLEERLKEKGVVLKPLEPEVLWAKLNENNTQQLDRLAELFGTVITLMKSNDCTAEQLRERNRSFLHSSSAEKAIELVTPLFEEYEKQLEQNGEIDFNDMINRASKFAEEKRYISPYRYVIVDEYQDISQARYKLLAAMRKTKDFNLFCVGDDWQSIYRFNGSDIGFILNFDKYWGKALESKIETTYRFPYSLIQVSSDFIMKNPEQKKKLLKSAVPERGFAVERIDGYTEEKAVQFLAEKLKDLPRGASVLFLGRYRFDIRMLDKNEDFQYRYNTAKQTTEVFWRKRPDLSIQFMTVHGSKGLQADYVFLLNNKAKGMGFPSQIADAPVLRLLLDNSDNYPHAEERRLFYVAITRAKKKVWLVALKNNESEFLREIEMTYGRNMQEERYRCPLCSGHLVKRNGKNGVFYGCSNYRYGCRYTRNILQTQERTQQVKPG